MSAREITQQEAYEIVANSKIATRQIVIKLFGKWYDVRTLTRKEIENLKEEPLKPLKPLKT